MKTLIAHSVKVALLMSIALTAFAEDRCPDLAPKGKQIYSIKDSREQKDLGVYRSFEKLPQFSENTYRGARVVLAGNVFIEEDRGQGSNAETLHGYNMALVAKGADKKCRLIGYNPLLNHADGMVIVQVNADGSFVTSTAGEKHGLLWTPVGN